MRDEEVRRVLLTGGGSGGHVFPALAIAAEMVARGWRVSYAGQATGMEAELTKSRGIDFYPLPAAAVVGKTLGQRIRAIVTLVTSTLRGAALVRDLGVAAVVATGGYACAAAALGARIRQRPLLLVEPNATAGLANRWLSRFAQMAALGYEKAASTLRCETRVTGVPVRREFFDAPRIPPLDDTWKILVLGGSQGAALLNRVVPGVVARVTELGSARLRVVHQAGAGKVGAPRQAYTESGVEADVIDFLDDVPAAMAACHLVLSRAGAVTLAEICAAGRPAVLFPLAHAAAHQVENARLMEEVGAAQVVLGDDELAALPELIAGLLEWDRLDEMARAARSQAHPGAAREITELLERMMAAQ